jgi:hypothetical protein
VQIYVVKAAARLEIVAGAIIVILPEIVARVLFRATLEGLAWPFARWVGIALLALGVACLPSKTTELQRHPVLGLLVFNAGVAVLLAWVGTTTAMRGPLLWPAVILHSLIAVALLLQLLVQNGAR